jgi:hypothetical protein
MRDAAARLGTPDQIAPSVTTIQRGNGTPQALTDWLREQVAKAAFANPGLQKMLLEENYVKAVLAAADESSEGAADIGTRTHRVIEHWLAGDMEFAADADIAEGCLAAKAWIDKNVKKVLASERSFCTPDGVFGGRYDLWTTDAIVDIKTQGFEKTPRPYPDHAEQLAAYRIGAGLPDGTRLINLYVSTKTPGLVVAHEWPNVTQWERSWRCTLDRFQIHKNWWPPPKHPPPRDGKAVAALRRWECLI